MQLVLNWCHAVCTVSSYIHQLCPKLCLDNSWTRIHHSLHAQSVHRHRQRSPNFYLRRDNSAFHMAAEKRGSLIWIYYNADRLWGTLVFYIFLSLLSAFLNSANVLMDSYMWVQSSLLSRSFWAQHWNPQEYFKSLQQILRAKFHYFPWDIYAASWLQ